MPAQWTRLAAQMQEAGELPAGYDPGSAFTSELIARINDWDRDAVAAQARAWKG